MLTSPWNSPIPCLKATVCLAEDRYNPHKEQSELNAALPLVKFPWKKPIFFKKKLVTARTRKKKIPDRLTGTSQLWENHPPSVSPFPKSWQHSLGGKKGTDQTLGPRGAQASAKGAASNHEHSPLASLTTKPRCVLSPGGRNNFRAWKSPFMKGCQQRWGCARAGGPHEGLGTAKAPGLSPPEHACSKAWSRPLERRPLYLPLACRHETLASSCQGSGW